MDTIQSHLRLKLMAVPTRIGSPAAAADDFRIARRRMRHLASWNVEPLPVMHSVDGTPTAPPSKEARERAHQLALHVLAVQIWQAGAMSALQ
jgi:hypothetical protein